MEREIIRQEAFAFVSWVHEHITYNQYFLNYFQQHSGQSALDDPVGFCVYLYTKYSVVFDGWLTKYREATGAKMVEQFRHEVRQASSRSVATA